MNDSDTDTELRAKLQGETDSVSWDELKPHYDRGAIVVVSNDLDLLDVATAMANDHKTAFERWIAQDKLGRVSDAQAERWPKEQPRFRTVVVAPWVLVQEI